MVIIGFKSGKEIELDIKLTSIKRNPTNGKLVSFNWDNSVKDKLKWFDIDNVDYIVERGD